MDIIGCPCQGENSGCRLPPPARDIDLLKLSHQSSYHASTTMMSTGGGADGLGHVPLRIVSIATPLPRLRPAGWVGRHRQRDDDDLNNTPPNIPFWQRASVVIKLVFSLTPLWA